MNRIKNLTEFIECYKQHPELWHHSINNSHKDISKNAEAGEELRQILSKLKKDATFDDVRKKINTLRSSYRKELKKVLQSEANDPDDVYVPTIWWYKHIDFLRVCYEKDFGSQLKAPREELEDYNTTSTEPVSQTFTAEPTPSPQLYEPEDNENPFQESTESDLLEALGLYFKEKEATAADVGHMWAVRCKDLADNQKPFAKKAIDDILYEARLGRLSRNSVEIKRK